MLCALRLSRRPSVLASLSLPVTLYTLYFSSIPANQEAKEAEQIRLGEVVDLMVVASNLVVAVYSSYATACGKTINIPQAVASTRTTYIRSSTPFACYSCPRIDDVNNSTYVFPPLSRTLTQPRELARASLLVPATIYVLRKVIAAGEIFGAWFMSTTPSPTASTGFPNSIAMLAATSSHASGSNGTIIILSPCSRRTRRPTTLGRRQTGNACSYDWFIEGSSSVNPPPPDAFVVVIGIHGSGKSYTSKLFASTPSWPCIDTDFSLEECYGMPTNQDAKESHKVWLDAT
ncbi:hypothetical protein PENSPDRAFT_671931 [Peniophora sp. CONT]|nr:hypothetical protein PENSPDRAFT_671931 [Peniophora sp. CONT]